MDLGLKGRRALIFGSSDGLGKAVAKGLAAEGAVTTIVGRDPEKVAAVVSELGAVAGFDVDLTRPEEAEETVGRAVDRLGGLDILVVNTGGGTPGGLLTTDLDDTDRAFRSMLRPALAAAHAAVQPLRESGQGRMVFMTARSILEATPELALSSVFRSGVAAAARSLAIELAPEVLVNVVVPGQFDTGAYHRFESWLAEEESISTDEVRERHLSEIPLHRLGKAEELADIVVFLCSARASFVTGSVMRVDGGAVRGF